MASIDTTPATPQSETAPTQQSQPQESQSRQDWSNKTNFDGITSIGYLCDNGEVITGDIERTKSNQIFLNFTPHLHSSHHYGSKYAWITVPNDRISPPPDTPPSAPIITFSQYISPPTTTTTTTTPYRPGQNEDEDLARALAASLGQTYTAPAIPRTNRTLTGLGYDPSNFYVPRRYPAKKEEEKDPHPSNFSMQEAEYLIHGWWKRELAAFMYEFPKGIIKMTQKWYYDEKAHEHFIAQPLLTFDDALEILFNGQCAFGVYDFKIKRWRAAIYMNHWPEKQRVMLRYTQDANLNPNTDYDKFVTLKIFPINSVQIDDGKFKTTERELRDMSNLPREKIDEWVERHGGTVRSNNSNNNNAQYVAVNANRNGTRRNNNNNNGNYNYVNFAAEDALLQQAIAASLQEQ